MKTILIVDDQERIRQLYKLIFTKEGYSVLDASCADKANEIVKVKKIDLILLDIKMPEVDGAILFETTKMFHPGIKVIVSSVYPLDDQKNLIEGAEDYYDKSESVKVLKEKVKNVLYTG